MQYPELIQKLISNFAILPGIGPKTAERLVFYLLKKNNKNDYIQFASNLNQVAKNIIKCHICGNYTQKSPCPICSNPKRNFKKICLVAEVQDIYYIEKTKAFAGVYHVLNGLLNPSLGITAENLNIKPFMQKLKQNNINEIIFGLNPTVEGESTIIYLKQIIKKNHPNIKLSRLSRGLPMGADLEYADEITLTNALNNRSPV